MNFSTYSGTAILPLLGRIVLFAAFLPMGAAKIFHQHVFEGEDARILIEMNVGTPVAGEQASIVAPPGTVRFASYQDDSGDDAAQDEPPTTGSLRDRVKSSGQELPESLPPVEPAPGQANPETGEAPVMTPAGIVSDQAVKARAVHHVTVLMDKGGWNRDWRPDILAWVAGLTELLGGAFVLVGLFSRLWGLGLAVTMGFAFYLTTWPVLLNTGWFGLSDDLMTFNRMYCQLGLLVLALGIFLTGAGPLSLDRFFFGGKPASAAGDEIALNA